MFYKYRLLKIMTDIAILHYSLWALISYEITQDLGVESFNSKCIGPVR